MLRLPANGLTEIPPATALSSPVGGRGAVLDAFAFLAFLQDEQGAARVARLLEGSRPGAPVVMSYVNLGEVLYIVEHERGQTVPDQVLATAARLPIRLLEVGRRQTIVAARFKARYPISYADAMCAALGSIADLPVVTGDPEFKVLDEEIELVWL